MKSIEFTALVLFTIGIGGFLLWEPVGKWILLAELNSSAVLMPRGTVLFSSRAPIGYIAISENEVCSNQGFKSIVPDKGFGSVFVYYTLKRNTPAIAKQGVGTTFKEVSRDTMERFKIVLPPVSITERFEHILHPLVEKRRSLEHENMELTKLRDWLLPMLMNGQATVK